jgi:hypothetical protein
MRQRISVSIVGSIALAITLSAGAAWAHHNMSALFDFNQRFTRTGTLTKLDWRNPHSYITVDATNDQGQMETWQFEGPAPNVFRNLNIGKADFEAAVGKTVKVEASRARDGSLKGLMRIITMPDGKAVSLCPQNC